MVKLDHSFIMLALLLSIVQRKLPQGWNFIASSSSNLGQLLDGKKTDVLSFN
jgi:hypothetical protein